jgi:hypothetical protein
VPPIYITLSPACYLLSTRDLLVHAVIRISSSRHHRHIDPSDSKDVTRIPASHINKTDFE